MNILKLVCLAFLIVCQTSLANAQGDPDMRYGKDDDGRTYTTIQEALNAPTPVYRLKLTKLPLRDSLPEELFQLTELRELTVKGCKLNIVNQNIEKLECLQYLNLDKNKLVRLPETIGKLKNLRFLCISRNMVETLPDAISNLTQLAYIDAWDNPLYILPETIKSLQSSLNTLDLRQIPLTKTEYLAMKELLPYTEILFTDICECENRRDHN